MKKIFLKLLFALGILEFLVILPLSALELAAIKPKLNVDLIKAVEILATQKSLKEKESELFAIFDEYFDYALMARLALGDAYKGLNDEQKKRFESAFVARLKFSFSEKLGLYTNQSIEITGDESPNPKRYFIHAQIKGENEVYKIIFKFHKKAENEYLLYDIDILGVSIIQTYRAQFEDLKNAGFDEILARINAKNAIDEAGKK